MARSFIKQLQKETLSSFNSFKEKCLQPPEPPEYKQTESK